MCWWKGPYSVHLGAVSHDMFSQFWAFGSLQFMLFSSIFDWGEYPLFNRCGKNKKDIIWLKYLVYTVRCCIWPKRISLFFMVSIWTHFLRDRVLFLASDLCFRHSVSMWFDFFAAFSILAGCSFCSSHPLSPAWFLILRLLKKTLWSVPVRVLSHL